MVKMGLGFLVEGVSPVCGHILRLFKLGIQGIVTASKAAADLHFEKSGNLANQGFQLGCDKGHSGILVHTLFQGIKYNVLNHIYTS